MEILTKLSKYPTGVVLILGFFDGVHLGHKAVISQAVTFAQKNNAKTVLITFKSSPKEYFTNEAEYIMPRKNAYDLIENFGVDYLLELDFGSIVNLSAEEYLEKFLIEKFKPISITTGFNHTFGKNKKGTPEFLSINAERLGYKYFYVEPIVFNDKIVSSTLIKEYLRQGLVDKANELLNSNFRLSSTVIKGNALGRKLGFPTANLLYPNKIVKLPYGVYKVIANGIPAILNWGVKPTVDGKTPILEVYLINFEDNLYDKELEIEFIKKIRDEKKFNSLEELQVQIKKDVEECLRL